MIEIATVVESNSNEIVLKITEEKNFENNKDALQVGRYLQIQNGNNQYVLVTINNLKAFYDGKKDSFQITTQPIGTLNSADIFKVGSVTLPSPTEKAFIPKEETLLKIFSESDIFTFELGTLVQNESIKLFLNGNSFFSKHIGVVGSTGSGKSCAVAKMLQTVVGIDDGKNKNKEGLKNSHVIIFDIHSEYESAFVLDKSENFTLNILNVEKLWLPYWLLNAEELETLFIESNEQNSHNQISQFKKAVTLNKEKHNPTYQKITYDTPVYFDIEEVYNYIYNLNEEVINKKDKEDHLPKLVDGTLISDRTQYFEGKYTFTVSSTAAASKASNGPFNGDFDRLLLRLETKLNDKRLKFLLNPQKKDGQVYKTDDFQEILKQFLGYLDKSNVTIIDLSGIPFEVLSITVSLISRLVFDFAFHYSKLRHSIGQFNDVPFMIVCEEAHNYIPRSNDAEFKASKKSIERIAKEGRKYGLSLMVVSQRPSEVSETIFSQCNNFIALRLTNSNDQSYIKSLLPDNSSSSASRLPSLASGECLVVGDATPISVLAKFKLPNPLPKSDSIKFHDEWNGEWKDITDKRDSQITFAEIITRWRKE
ncbi:ATP-binding protein [Paenibacillus polymyxa]|nr:ATP-binding protein [Paenibacillus polymyxa]